MTENNSIPESTPATTPVADSPAITPRSDDSTDARKRSRTRTLLIAGGSVLAAAVLASGGIAVGAAIADDTGDDDRDSSSESDDSTSEDNADDSANDSGDDDAGDSSDDDDAAGMADVGSNSADELNDLISTASASADGEAVAIEANRDGSWDVTFETSGGQESDVRVTADGTAEVVSTDAAEGDDSAALDSLDAARVDALVAAAMAEVDGKITDIELDDDTASPYDISVVTADGHTVELDLDKDMNVLSTSGS
jgi:uncharacterized membrane protein YkoI